MAPQSSPRLRLHLLSSCAVLATVAALLILMLVRSNGVLVYTLDDAYIHMAMAEQIWQGHYGVNAHEFSAPCSSVLWPFILAPFSSTGRFFDYVPLLLNVVFATWTVVLLSVVLVECCRFARIDVDRRILTIAALGLALSANVIGLIFLGMEHSLQLLVSVALAWGLVVFVSRGVLRIWLIPVLVMGPLVRYENLALSVLAIAMLLLHGQRRAALTGGIAIALSLGTFSLFLRHLGLEVLPTAVLAKSSLLTVDGAVTGFWTVPLTNLQEPRGLILLAVAVILFLCSRLRELDAKARHFALGAGGSLLAHLCVGRLGWYHRYEVYVWTAGIVTLLVVLALVHGARRAGPRLAGRGLVVAAALTICLGSFSYVRDIGTVPLASFNIYRQQYQIRRIALAFDAPVAVNDLGLVAYRNANHVLDLRGLASLAALRARQGPPNRSWMAGLCDEHGVELAMLCEAAFWWGLPPRWTKVAELRYVGRNVNQSGNSISLFATGARGRGEIAEFLARVWSFPRGVSLTLCDTPHDSAAARN